MFPLPLTRLIVLQEDRQRQLVRLACPRRPSGRRPPVADRLAALLAVAPPGPTCSADAGATA